MSVAVVDIEIGTNMACVECGQYLDCYLDMLEEKHQFDREEEAE